MYGLLTAAVLVFFPPELETWYRSCGNGDWEAAAAAAEDLIDNDPSDAEAMSALIVASVLASTGPVDTVTAGPAPDTAGSLASTARGAILMSGSGNFLEDAGRQFEEAVELDPGNVISWYMLGRLKLSMDEPAAAESCFLRAVSLDPGFLPAELEAARIIRDRGDLRQASLDLRNIMDSRTPAGDMAMAEYILLSRRLGMTGEADSLMTVLEERGRGTWLRLAEEQAAIRPEISLMAAEEALETASSGLARLYVELERYATASEICRELLNEGGGDSTGVMTLLGTALFRMEEHGKAEEAFLAVLDRDPVSVTALLHLGRIAEMEGNISAAVEYYLSVLEANPFDGDARARLREIADDSYDPESVTGSATGFSASAGADLSVERGSRDLLEWGGSSSLSYRFDRRGTAIDCSFGGRSVTWEESSGLGTDTLNSARGWARLGFDYWFSEDFYVQAQSSWDRQMYTERPWRISSHGALGWRKWVFSRFWFSPRLGVGSINARWTSGREEVYTNDLTLFAAAGLKYSKPHTFLRRAEISGSVYFPPDDPQNFVSGGNVSLTFRSWNSLYIVLGYDIDYTRSPEISTWEKFNTSFTTSINLDLY
ncbi:MAG: tetratricopeptide repeat protein [Candidatus Aegiribacteria sp.]